MPELFLPEAEIAYTRTVLLAVELLDAVTLEPVSRGVRVSAPPLAARPFLNGGNRFIWLLTGAERPERIQVDPGMLPYERMDVAAPDLPPDLDNLPEDERESRRLRRLWLRPRRGYRFPDGVTVLQGRLGETSPPSAPVTDAELWVEWQELYSGSWKHQRERMSTRTGKNGEFVAFLHLGALATPKRDERGLIEVRLGVKRPHGETRYGTALALPEGWQDVDFKDYAWNELAP